MSPPSRATEAGRTYLALRALARAQNRPTDEVFVLYILERFLHRLSLSSHRDRLVLKVGMLLAAFDDWRPTADVDLLARALHNDIDAAIEIGREALAVHVDDGVAFDLDAMRAAVIRDTAPTAPPGASTSAAPGRVTKPSGWPSRRTPPRVRSCRSLCAG